MCDARCRSNMQQTAYRRHGVRLAWRQAETACNWRSARRYAHSGEAIKCAVTVSGNAARSVCCVEQALRDTPPVRACYGETIGCMNMRERHPRRGMRRCNRVHKYARRLPHGELRRCGRNTWRGSNALQTASGAASAMKNRQALGHAATAFLIGAVRSLAPCRARR